MILEYVVCAVLGLIIGTLFGIKITKNALKKEEQSSGLLIVLTDEVDNKKYLALDLNLNPEEIENLDYVTFKVTKGG